MKLGALILAAGICDNNTFSPIDKVGSLSAIKKLINTFHKGGVDNVVIIADEGEYFLQLKKHILRMNVEILTNDDSNSQMFDSVKVGLNYFINRCDKLFISPVDIPLFSVETIKLLLESEADIVSPVNKEIGHPLLISNKSFEKILSYTGSGGLKGAIEHTNYPHTLVEVSDPGILLDIEKSNDYQDILENHLKEHIEPDAKIYLMKKGDMNRYAFFGPGTSQLLSSIDATGSVRLACQTMGMSYSKGWKLLGEAEENLGYELVIRRQGGKSGGEAHLTEKAVDFIERYKHFEEECKESVESIYKKYFD